VPPLSPAPRFFTRAEEFRRWLAQNHASAGELWIGYYKKASGRGGMVYREALDEALCFGWIDGQVRSLGPDAYMQRFTPRRPGSIWSNVNVRHVQRLDAAGKMQAAGRAAFAARKAAKTGVYSFEAREAPKLSPEQEQTFRAHRAAWTFFKAQPAGYRRAALHKVVSPKRAETRERWLARLIADSAAGRRLAALA
jgi:uncharacterized protein YdeI (YjbR/CyaY-like superfamily)